LKYGDFHLSLKVSAAPGNPFPGADFYTNPDYYAEVQRSINANPSLAPLLRKAQNISAAYWIDTMARIPNITKELDGAKQQQARTGRPTLTAFVIYDVPNRDCAAAASNGELHCSDNNCADALSTYKTKYIDPIIAILKNYGSQPIVAFVEPDSLGNLATNMNIAKCQQAQTAYMQGISYAIQQLSTLSNVVIYLDACHGGWLGWDDNRQKISQVYQQLLSMSGGQDKIRGFVTNLANYQPTGSLSSSADPCNLGSQYNKAVNEVIYVNMLAQSLQSVGITGKGWVIDTSRNGVTNMRKDCSNWCNINNSGMGYRPQANPTSITGLSIIDAFYWVKTPGESDGTSNQSSPRYDFHCTSSDSKIPAPEAGSWFSDYFIMLCQNANPPL